jgi:hypothetical protein
MYCSSPDPFLVVTELLKFHFHEFWIEGGGERERERERERDGIILLGILKWRHGRGICVRLLRSSPYPPLVRLLEVSQRRLKRKGGNERRRFETGSELLRILYESTFVPDANCKLLWDSLQNWKCPQYKGRAASHTAFCRIEGATETQFRTLSAPMAIVFTIQGLQNAGH